MDADAGELRAREIVFTGRKVGIDHHLVEKAISGGTSVRDFKEQCLDFLKTHSSYRTKTDPEDEFSLRRFILDKSENRSLNSIEQSVVFAEQQGVIPANIRGNLVPKSVLDPLPSGRRDLVAGVDASGGYTVDTELQRLIQPLDPDTPLWNLSHKLDARNPFDVPIKASASTAEWTEETGAAQEANITFDVKSVKPKHLRAWTTYSRELLLTPTVQIENLVRSDLRRAIRQGTEKAILQSTGLGGQPVGLQNNTAIRTVRYPTDALTFDHCEQAEELLLDSNVAVQDARGQWVAGDESIDPRIDNLKKRLSTNWIVSPKFRRLAKKIPALGAGTSQAIWDNGDKGTNEGVRVRGMGNQDDPKILEYGAYVSTYAAANDAYFGNWSELVLVQFGGIDIIVDPFTLSTRGLIRVTSLIMLDFFLRHNASIVRLTV